MKPNSCLYVAVSEVVAQQFGISDLPSDVFDRCNDGDGIVFDVCVPIINEALSEYGVQVEAVYANHENPSQFSNPEILHPAQFVPIPCIAVTDTHATAMVYSSQYMDAIAAIAAITLTRI